MLKDLMPGYYDGVREMEALLNTEQHSFDEFDNLIQRWLMNHFVTHADSQGLAIYEDMLKIPTDYSKSLETRRYDILLRLLPPRPITFKYFQSLIKSFNIPANVQRDVQEQFISTFSGRDNITDSQLDRLKYLLNVYLPVNMVFQININSEARSELPFYMDIVTVISATAIVRPQLQRFAMANMPIKLNSVTQLYSETVVRPKEV